MGGPPAPGQIMPRFMQDALKLTDDQKKQLDDEGKLSVKALLVVTGRIETDSVRLENQPVGNFQQLGILLGVPFQMHRRRARVPLRSSSSP